MRWLCLLPPLLLSAQSTAPLTNPVRAILDAARAEPAEIFADVALQVLDRGDLTPQVRKALLEDVFARGQEAVALFPMRGGDFIAAPWSDQLSVRCTAVRRMLDLDTRRARELFEMLPPLEIPKSRCDQFAVADPDIYLQTLAEVMERGEFTNKERDDRVPWRMVESAVRRIGSSLELAPALLRLAGLATTEEEVTSFAAAVGVALMRSDSDRNFTNALRKYRLIQSVFDLAATERQSHVSDVPTLTGLRDFLVRHLSGTRCEDNVQADDAAAFNQELGDRTDIPPITADEGKAAKVEEFGRLPLEEAEAALAERFEMQELTVSVRSKAPPEEWLGKVKDANFLRNSPALRKRMSLILMGHALFEPRGAGKIFLEEALATLSNPAALRQNPPEWLAAFKLLADRSTANGRALTEALTVSRFSTLALYGRLRGL